MNLINNTSEDIIAIPYSKTQGFGKEITVKPGGKEIIQGPYLGEMGGGSCYVVIQGDDIVCQSSQDDENGYYVAKGSPLILEAEDLGVIVRHFEDEMDEILVSQD